MAHCGQMGQHQRFQCEGWSGAARDSNLVTALSLYGDQSDCTLCPPYIERSTTVFKRRYTSLSTSRQLLPILSFANRIVVRLMPAGLTRGADIKKCCLDGESAVETVGDTWLLIVARARHFAWILSACHIHINVWSIALCSKSHRVYLPESSVFFRRRTKGQRSD
jgi:hypothetical protein